MSRWEEYIQTLANIKADDIKVVRFEGTRVIETQTAFPNLNILKPAMLAQAILESGRGTSKVAEQCLNFHGLKWRTEMGNIAQPQSVGVSSEPEGSAEFCRFRTLADEIKGYWQFIQRSPYPDVLAHTRNVQDFLGYIGHTYCPSGYEEQWIADHGDKDYDDYICDNLLEEAKTELRKYGWREERPSVSEVLDQRFLRIPFARSYNEIQTSWRYPQGYPEGAIVHFTAGASIESSLDWLKYKNFPCLGIGRDGTLYQSFPLDRGGVHCGTDHEYTHIGIEVASAGRCERLENGKYRTYFGKILNENQIRSSLGNQNIQPGHYEKFTDAQEETLEQLLLWLKANYPGVFDLAKILGHDEVTPQNKNDPGAALSRTMPEYRNYIRQRYGEVYGNSAFSVYYGSWSDQIVAENRHIRHTVTKYVYDNPVNGTPSGQSRSVVTDADLPVQKWEALKTFVMNSGFENLLDSYGAPEDMRYYPYGITVSRGGEKKTVKYRSNPAYEDAPAVFHDIEKYLLDLSEQARG